VYPDSKDTRLIRTYLKNRILVQNRGGAEFSSVVGLPAWSLIFVGHKPQVRLRRIEDLKRGINKDIGPKDIFEMGSKCGHGALC
jgi:hypothetical protein